MASDAEIGAFIDRLIALPNEERGHAVRGMTKTAALELGDRGIRVNSIHPGHIATPMNNPMGTEEGAQRMREYCERDVPLARVGLPKDIAWLALFLSSEESAYCTGSEFTADGGLIAGVPVPG